MTATTEIKTFTPTPIEKWGKDHWSLLAFVECGACDKFRKNLAGDSSEDPTPFNLAAAQEPLAQLLGVEGLMLGVMDMRRVRISESKYPLLVVNPGAWKDEYGTRLKGGENLPGHCDIECLDDLECYGLITVVSLVNGIVGITPLGQEVALAIRRHKARGGNFADFVVPDSLYKQCLQAFAAQEEAEADR